MCAWIRRTRGDEIPCSSDNSLSDNDVPVTESVNIATVQIRNNPILRHGRACIVYLYTHKHAAATASIYRKQINLFIRTETTTRHVPISSLVLHIPLVHC